MDPLSSAGERDGLDYDWSAWICVSSHLCVMLAEVTSSKPKHAPATTQTVVSTPAHTSAPSPPTPGDSVVTTAAIDPHVRSATTRHNELGELCRGHGTLEEMKKEMDELSVWFASGESVSMVRGEVAGRRDASPPRGSPALAPHYCSILYYSSAYASSAPQVLSCREAWWPTRCGGKWQAVHLLLPLSVPCRLVCLRLALYCCPTAWLHCEVEPATVVATGVHAHLRPQLRRPLRGLGPLTPCKPGLVVGLVELVRAWATNEARRSRRQLGGGELFEAGLGGGWIA